jgi:hypothetical protein
MIRILKDPVWQFVGVIVGIAAIAVSFWLYYESRPVKKLRVEILSNSPVVSLTSDVPKELQILYRGKPVQTLSLILLRLANTGTEPIRESDYSEPIRVSVSQNAEIGQVMVQETRPDGIYLAPTIIANNQVELTKVLLNPGDQAVLKILVLNNDKTLKVNARIAGVRDLELQSVLERSDISSKESAPMFARYVLVGFGGFVILFFLFFSIWHSRKIIEWRIKRFGFDPALYFYTRAQEAMLSGSSSTRIRNVIRWLDRAFRWDNSYIERAKNESLFSDIHGYRRFLALIEKYKAVAPLRKDK